MVCMHVKHVDKLWMATKTIKLFYLFFCQCNLISIANLLAIKMITHPIFFASTFKITITVSTSILIITTKNNQF